VLPSGPILVVSVHDVAAATTGASQRWCEALDRRGVPASLLVVPGPWRGRPLSEAPELAAWLRDRVATGDEIVQHGWAHRAPPCTWGWRWGYGWVVARGAAEFAALGAADAYRRLVAGRRALDGAGLPAAGFTPPGWLHSAGTLRALRRLDFRFTTCHRGILDLHTGRLHTGLALSHRPGGRGERPAARMLGAWARLAAGRGGTVRIALHPDDLSRPHLRRTTLSAIDAVLAAGARPITYSGALRDLARDGSVQ
jgi:predicted deacetylase